MSYSAYTQAQNRAPTSSRDVEYRLLGAVISALIEAEGSGSVIKRVDAVCWNREVWSVFRMDLKHPDNGLPQEIKDQLVDISKWVDRETFRILGGDTDKLDGLIEVNKNIMNGLKPKDKPAPAQGSAQ